MKLLLVLLFASGGTSEHPVPYRMTIETIKPITADLCPDELERWKKAVTATDPGLVVQEQACIDDGVLAEPRQPKRKRYYRRHRRRR